MFDMRTQRVAVDASASGENVLLPAIGGTRYRVPAGVLVAAGAVTVKFIDGAGGADLTGAMALAANGVLPLPHNPESYVETSVGKALVISLGGAVAVRGVLTVLVIKARGE